MPEPVRPSARYAVCMIPPYQIARAVAEIHGMLRKQYGLSAADRFPVHATIKGFFKRAEGPLEPLVERLDRVFAAQRPLPVSFCGLRRDPAGVRLDISCLGDGPNLELVALHERVVAAVQPFVAADCDFTPLELCHPFGAHITLAFGDFQPALQDQVLDYLLDAAFPGDAFVADTFHLIAFFSHDWEGDWDQSLSWKLLKSWCLLGVSQRS